MELFKVGTCVVYENRGICRIEAIAELNLSGAQSGKKYYELKPIYENVSKIYSKVDNDKVLMRPVMTKEEAEKLLDEIPDIPEIWIGDEKQREMQYREAMSSGDARQWVSIIKTLFLRKQSRLQQGKKTTNTDDRYFKRAESSLYGELALALGMNPDEMEAYIAKRMDVAEDTEAEEIIEEK